jgi:hypothetical protein
VGYRTSCAAGAKALLILASMHPWGEGVRRDGDGQGSVRPRGDAATFLDTNEHVAESGRAATQCRGQRRWPLAQRRSALRKVCASRALIAPAEREATKLAASYGPGACLWTIGTCLWWWARGQEESRTW